MRHPHLYHDLESAALYGLALSANRYNAALGVPFFLYAARTVRWACLNEIRAYKRLASLDVRVSDHDGGTIWLSETIADCGDDAESALESEDAVRCILRPFGRGGQAVANRFLVAGYTVNNMSQYLGVSYWRATKIQREVLAEIRRIGCRVLDKINPPRYDQRCVLGPKNVAARSAIRRYDEALRLAGVVPANQELLPASRERHEQSS